MQEITLPKETSRAIKKTERVLGEESRSYVIIMANTLGVKLQEQDFDQFTTLTVAEINKRLAAMARAQAVAKQSELTASALSNLSLMGRSRITDMRRQYQSRLDEAKSRVLSYYTQATTHLETMASISASMRSLDANDGVDVAEQVRSVLSGGWYSLDDVSSTAITFSTPSVMLRYFNSELSIDKTINMGTFKVKVIPASGRLQVLHGENNLYINGYMHPHISTAGEVCWGNAHSAYTRLASDLNMVPALTALQSLLQSYNYDSPYERFDKFEEKRALRDKGLAGDLEITEPTTLMLGRLRYEYDGALAPVRNAKRLFASSSRWFVECANYNGTTYAALADGSYCFTGARGLSLGASYDATVEYTTLEDLFRAYVSREDVMRTVDMVKLNSLSDAELRSLLSNYPSHETYGLLSEIRRDND